MRLNYIALIERINVEQGLGLQYDEIPVIIHTENMIYSMSFITYEDDKYMIIIVPDEDGVEYAKILNKTSVLSVEIVYAQMFTENKNSKGDVSYV